MARGIRHTDTSPGWIKREIRAIRDELRELRSAKRVITNLTIPAGEGTTSNGIVEVGDMPHGDRGLVFRREDGTMALLLRKILSPTSPQTWQMYDRAGGLVVSESGVSPGLGRPALDLPFQPVAAASGTAVTCGPYGLERVTTSGTFETLFAYDGRAQNYLLDFKFAAMCSDGTTAGEIRVVDLDTGLPRPGFLSPAWLGSIPAGTVSMTLVDPTPDQVLSTVGTVGAGGYMRLGVQVRRTAGTGTITLSVAQSTGG